MLQKENTIEATTLKVNLPRPLAELAGTYVREGWFPDLDALIAEALRRYLESHRADLMEQFIREDVAWGLQGIE